MTQREGGVVDTAVDTASKHSKPIPVAPQRRRIRLKTREKQIIVALGLTVVVWIVVGLWLGADSGESFINALGLFFSQQ